MVDWDKLSWLFSGCVVGVEVGWRFCGALGSPVGWSVSSSGVYALVSGASMSWGGGLWWLDAVLGGGVSC